MQRTKEKKIRDASIDKEALRHWMGVSLKSRMNWLENMIEMAHKLKNR